MELADAIASDGTDVEDVETAGGVNGDGRLTGNIIER